MIDRELQNINESSELTEIKVTDATNTTNTLIPQVAPTSPVEGMIYYDVTDKLIKLWNGTTWVDLFADLGMYVPYTGATGDVDLGDYQIDVKRLLQSNNGLSIFIGEDAGLNDDLTNNVNVFIGANAGKANTWATDNVAIGYNTLLLNVSGQKNIAIGTNAISATTESDNNTAIGYDAFYTIDAASSNNVALGGNAGKNIGDANNLINANNSIFIGQASKANANSETNQTVIGFNATGNGSNSVTLGDTNVTGVYMGSTKLATEPYVDNKLSAGASGTFDTATNRITVTNGLITDIGALP